MLFFEAMHRPSCSGGYFLVGKLSSGTLSWLLVYGYSFLWNIQQGPISIASAPSILLFSGPHKNIHSLKSVQELVVYKMTTSEMPDEELGARCGDYQPISTQRS